MILEIATFLVTPGRELKYEQAIAEAIPIIAAAKGYCRHELRRCIERENQYAFLVYWETLENHTVDFRKSAAYADWKGRLHNFYEAPPSVQHFRVPSHFSPDAPIES